MGLGLLFIPTLGGYWFLRCLYYTRYDLLRDSGYHVLFKSAIAGCSLVVVARLIIVLLLNPYLPCISEIWKSYVPFDYYGTVALSVLLGIMLPIVINQFYGEEKASKRAASSNGDLIELLINESIEKEKFVELSLKSRKFYIGVALASGIASHGESDIALIPVASGYRKEDTHELEITTNYAPVLWEFLKTKKASGLVDKDFRIVIPMSEIVTARIFDPDVYARFKSDNS